MADFILYQSIIDADGEKEDACSWNAFTLHHAIKDVQSTRTAHVDGVEYTSAQYQAWNNTAIITVSNGAEFYTGKREERTLAIIGITRASARRIARLIRAQWQA